ncbi:parallel beta-helix domain-containing protein [Neotabrizicola shimadae]|uniref:Right-handed parallel beta-helix repeat-containing protein n=1 Tax=Neotabrizicola shimadae TaxID=2807096 RepID=A0A8G0ZQV9_9RHOB|nr:parallel beta-helix domain-containing protein [Neotabrizicola shimadae]QYZ68734.1 right-handed parallel beta-helix repeat-containing protein [Neotabrizicola shimadae]
MTKHLILLALLASPAAAETFAIAPGPDAEAALQEALILAQPGDEVVLAPGRYDIVNQLSLANEDVTLRGAGMDASVLSFKGQTGGAEGLIVTANGAILKDFAVEDAKGDAIKAKGVDGIAMIRLRAEWTNGPDAANGAYGFYPVESRNVLLDGVVAIGASDAGIYVGQSQRIVVRNSRAEYNVAGLEIENCYYADVFDNLVTNNTGGLLVFDLPDLPQQKGHDIRVFHNRSLANNTPNFAPQGNIVGLVPAGTGMLIMANTDVEVFDNDFADNKTVNLIFGSYVKDFTDESYYPHPRRIHIHDNRFTGGGTDPDPGEFGSALRKALGVPVPDVVWDGVMPLSQWFTTGLAAGEGHLVANNSHATNPPYANADFVGFFGLPFLHSVKTDPAELSEPLAPLPPVQVVIRGRDVSHPGAWAEFAK